MRVSTYELISSSSGLTAAGLDQIASRSLLLNGIRISGNLPSIEIRENLIQLDVCEECFQPGCSSEGFVQVFKLANWVIWKLPYIETDEARTGAASGLKDGSIYWEASLYASFLAEFNHTANQHAAGLTSRQAFDLWRIHAVKTIFPQHISAYYSLEQLEEEVIGFYSSELSGEQSKEIYFMAKHELHTGGNRELSLLERPDASVAIIAMSYSNAYKEWECIYYDNGTYYYPVGDQLVVRLG
ncbi:hypothetical protein AB4Z29_31640 [Paenibacillus sp. 2TAB23]|uniref:hypothetical protein n=1 Tax=Paenibacillus sp. 2TAB23 TaxID=3233004 RepID=UPI003F96C24D